MKNISTSFVILAGTKRAEYEDSERTTLDARAGLSGGLYGDGPRGPDEGKNIFFSFLFFFFTLLKSEGDVWLGHA